MYLFFSHEKRSSCVPCRFDIYVADSLEMAGEPLIPEEHKIVSSPLKNNFGERRSVEIGHFVCRGWRCESDRDLMIACPFLFFILMAMQN